ncbi:hypothetical protein ACQRIT_002945 [Beauveria bassiana]
MLVPDNAPHNDEEPIMRNTCFSPTNQILGLGHLPTRRRPQGQLAITAAAALCQQHTQPDSIGFESWGIPHAIDQPMGMTTKQTE